MSFVQPPSCSPQGWLERRLRTQAAALLPDVPWAVPPLAFSCGAAAPAQFPDGLFWLGDVKVPERNIEWPAALLFRAALLCAAPTYRRSCGHFLASGGLEALLCQRRLTAEQRITIAGGAGVLMLCRQS